MNDRRRLFWISGRLVSTPLTDFWQISRTVQDPSIPNLPMETPSGGSASGTYSATEGADALSASGAVTVSSSYAATENADTVSASGNIPVSSIYAAAEGSDSLGANGDIPISSLYAATEGADAVVGTGSGSAVSGVGDIQEAADSLSCSCTVTNATRAVSMGDFWWITNRRQTKEEVERERERMGIIPKRAKKIIKRVAREAVADAEAIKVQRLIAELEAAHLQYEAWYAELLQKRYDKLLHEEIKRLMQLEMRKSDEEEIALLMLLAA